MLPIFSFGVTTNMDKKQHFCLAGYLTRFELYLLSFAWLLAGQFNVE